MVKFEVCGCRGIIEDREHKLYLKHAINENGIIQDSVFSR